MAAFDEWAVAVDALCRQYLACGWHDLCGDIEPLQRSFADGEGPLDFVRRFADKHQLTWVEPPARPLTTD